MMDKFKVHTDQRYAMVDITKEIQKIITSHDICDGVAHIFIPHTTAAVTVNENCDPAVAADTSDTLQKLIPHEGGYAHREGNSDAHIKAALVGSNRTLFIEDGKICFGTWQGVYLCEFDGPRTREVWVKIVKEGS
jgi:secondary thiamine-phosphate synthase enzyme